MKPKTLPSGRDPVPQEMKIPPITFFHPTSTLLPLRWGVAGAFFLLTVFGNAQVLRLTEKALEYELAPFLEYLPAEVAEELTYDEIAERTFSPLPEHQNFKSHQSHWLKIGLRNEHPNASEKLEWVLHFSLIPTDVSYHILDGQGNLFSGKTGSFLPPEQRSFKPAMKGNFGKIILPPNEDVTLFMRIKSDRVGMAPSPHVKLYHSDVFLEKLKKEKQQNGIFIGFIILIFIYNLFLFLVAKDRAFLYYSAYLFGLVLFTVYNTGDLADWLTGLFFNQKPQTIYFFKTATYLAIVSYLAFLRYFLNLKKLLPKWDRVFQWSIYLTPIFWLADVFTMKTTNFNYSTADFFTVGYTLLFLMLSVIFLFPLSKTTDKKRYFIIGGFLAMGCGVVFTIIDRFQTVDFSTFPLRVGIVIEVIIFSLGLAYRQRESEREKQAASFELEKSKIYQEQKEREAKRLEELAVAKNQFYTNITHEFRTPLTVIIGVAKELEAKMEKTKKTAPSKFQVSLIQRNGEQLLRQINQLLDLSKLDSGTLKTIWSQGNIVQFLAYLVESFYNMAAEKKVELVFSHEPDELYMDYDADKFQHIVYNLLSNAIKFSRPKDKVNLHLQKVIVNDEERMKLTVSDTGIGISEAELPFIFERYFQASSAQNSGTGVGLALTKELVELIGGNIAVQSEIGKGSVFTLSLPITNDANLVEEKSQTDSHFPSTAFPNDTEKKSSLSGDENKPYLLLIEDNPDVAIYVESILKNDYTIRMAKDGQTGIELALETVPDLIISDVMMPEKNGFEVCDILKNDERTSHVPIILLTAKATEADRVAGLKVGADAYLMKPFNKGELLVRLEKLRALRLELQKRYSTPNSQELPIVKKADNSDIENAFLSKLSEIVESNFENTDFGVVALCQKAGMSNTQLNRKLKALTGATPSRFIRKIRLNKAKSLLESSDMNVSEIAYQVGFNDPNYFTRLFSEEFGHPPSKFYK